MEGHITLGSYCLISPGIVITAADHIDVGDNCMFAANCYVSDCEWYGLYNRTRPFRCTKPITLKDNVWVGHGSRIGKGVTVGENSVVAVDSVVVKDVPDDVVVGGNPAKVIKTLNPNRRMLKREMLFSNSDFYEQNQKDLDRYVMEGNAWRNWLRVLLKPGKRD